MSQATSGPVLQFVAVGARAALPSPRAASPLSRPASTTAPMSADDRQEFRAGVRQERRRWRAVLGSSAFAGNPTLAAHLLADSSQPASEIIALLRRVSADAATAQRRSEAAIQARWDAAFARVQK